MTKKRIQNPTMNDVAKEAGVSVATVSRVVNDPDSVSEKLRLKVQRAMQRLHYHPSSFARAFKMKETRLVGVIVPLLDHPFYGRMATAIEKTLFTHNYRAIICNAEEDSSREKAYIEMLLQQRVDGIIINSSAIDATDYLKDVEDVAMPYVLIDRNLPSANGHRVFCDNSQGGYTGMKYLIELGHERIGVVAGPKPTTSEPISRRIEGVRRAMQECGIEENPELVMLEDDQLFDMGYRVGKKLLSLEQPPTAIFALTDVTAVGVMHAADELGFSVPDDLSVLGYDDIPIASYIIPPLSTVKQPIVEMGQAAVEILLDSIQNKDFEPKKMVLNTYLIVRRSTGEPRSY